MNQLIPIARCPISVRPATMADVPFIDALQKKHSKMVGWFPTKQIEGKIAAGNVLIAEDAEEQEGLGLRLGLGLGNDQAPNLHPHPNPNPNPSSNCHPIPLGYCIAQDKYSGRDDVGVIYQLNVVPTVQRKLIGATLIKAVFDRAAYGCKLFCLWCAQDIAANFFWESIGFIPLAFRTGSRSRGKAGSPRMHIFWQRRIREGDETTPYWFPSQTKSGAIREDRLVIPIPPGTHWRDVMPVILPGAPTTDPTALPAPKVHKPKVKTPALNPLNIRAGGLRLTTPAEKVAAEKPKRERQPAAKHDPQQVAAARELRDRYMEQFNANSGRLTSSGKYDVARLVAPATQTPAILQLPHAA